MPTVHVRYYASARAAAGTDAERLELPENATVADAIDAARNSHGEALGRVLDAAGFLVDSVAVRDRGARLTEGATLDVLPPFAGG